MSKQRIIIDAPESAEQFKSIVDLQSDKRQSAHSLSAYMASLSGGVRSANLKVNVDAEQAQAEVTFTGNPTADEIITIANVVLTAKAATPSNDEFLIGVGATANATNLAAAINANTDLQGIVSAKSDAGVVTLTAKVPGKIGNGIQLSEGLSNATITQAFDDGSEGQEFELPLE